MQVKLVFVPKHKYYRNVQWVDRMRLNFQQKILAVFLIPFIIEVAFFWILYELNSSTEKFVAAESVNVFKIMEGKHLTRYDTARLGR